MNDRHPLPKNAEETTLRFSSDMMRDAMQEMQVYRAAIKEITTKLENLDGSFEVRFEYNPIHHIESRLKSIPSIIKKLQRLDLEPSVENMKKALHDVAGVRVICNYFDDLDKLAEMLLAQEDVRLIRRKDYHKNPKPNGYRSLHLVVATPVYLANERREVMVEIQIRTIAMDLWASLEHQLRYKNGSDRPVPDDLSYRLFSCAKILSEVDSEMQYIYDEIQKLNGREE